jgi:hypothetical protein
VWIYRTEIHDEEELLHYVIPIIAIVGDAEKLAAQWIPLACGYTEDEALDEHMEMMMNRFDGEGVYEPNTPWLERLDVLSEE